MDLSDIARKLDLSDSKHVIRRAAELRRLCDIQFDSSIIGVGEVCKAVICLEIAATRSGLLFDRKKAITLSGMSEKAYTRCYNSMQNGLGVRNKLDVREPAIQFGCVRIVPLVQKALSLYKAQFLASLPASRQASAGFTRPVFIAAAFYLCAKKHKLKVDKLKLIELCGTSETEFSSVSTSMKDLCFDVCGIEKEKKDPKHVKGNGELLDVWPEKGTLEDGGYSFDEGTEPSSYKRHKKIEKRAYEGWKTSVLTSNRETQAEAFLRCDSSSFHSSSHRLHLCCSCFGNSLFLFAKDEDEKNSVSKRTVVKGVLLQQTVQAIVAIILFTVTGNDGGDAGTKPSFIDLGRQFVIAMVVLDTWQYFMHRYMHHNKFLYKHIHSQHHRLVVPYAFGALYNHPVEGLLLDTIGGALSFLFSGMSPRASIFFFSFATIKTVDDHCGLWLPGNLFHALFRNNTAYHDVHHQLYGNKYNFSQPFFVMWDRILGTYMPYSLEKRAGGGFEVRPKKVEKEN
ncbi:origin recognition complex subunit 6 [Pyrus ussuriensis x Pyrus communis]|uniref:Origin recognition complex subunit 6 n=1 Tax=Pyrus ussuriensis x Pyrus communis TaxID=2448454 RepID=A0A5N5HEE2_9ROSA|nr:origin recognition complex subunit 6 [Pyrus ussuriensis x Pyrus communis]